MNSHIQLNDAGEFLRYISAGIAIEWDENNYCTPEALIKDGKAEQFRVVEMVEIKKPPRLRFAVHWLITIWTWKPK
jgi:hypothetical protein